VIEVENLNLSFKDKILLQNISFKLKANEHLAIIGKSGSGKSLLAKSLVLLFDKNYNLSAEKLKLNQSDMLGLNKISLQKARAKFALILQDAHLSFYPYLDLGAVFDIILKTHTNLNTKERKQHAFFYLRNLGFENLDLLWHSYIHQLSVGMARRVTLALALSLEPELLICDEITASLDDKNQEKINTFLQELKTKLNIVFITHDLAFAKSFCNRVLFMQKGKILEQSSFEDFLQNPQNEETRAYLKAYKDVFIL